MKTRWKCKLSAMLLVGVLAVMVPKLAMAVITPACTSVVNNATLKYKVATIPQTDKTGTATFVVGNKVIVVVEKVGTAQVVVSPNSNKADLLATDKVLEYTVTNNGNARQDYVLSVTAGTSNVTIDPWEVAVKDNFDLTGVEIRVETANAGFDPTDDVVLTTPFKISNLDPGASKTIYVSPSGSDPNVIATQANDSRAVYILEAVSYKGNGGVIEANTTTATGTLSVTKTDNTTCNAEIQLAETTHTSNKSGETANNGSDSARHTFKVAAANLTVTKAATTIWDPINLNSSPKPIPGALVQYVITITNGTGAPSATLTSITDTLIGVITHDPELKAASTATTYATLTSASGSAVKGFKTVQPAGRTDPDTVYHTNAADTDAVDIVGTLITADMAEVLPADGTWAAGELKGGESVTLTFNVLVN